MCLKIFKQMKKLYPILFSLCLLLCLTHTSMAQNVNIPNATFKAYLVGNASINTNGDADIQVSEAIAFSGDIVVPSMNITDLTGIEAFTSITHLNCAFNQLTSLNVSANTALNYLYCDDNLLTNLDVSANTALILLNCLTNSLTSLDVSKNIALKYLKCFDNSITNLNLSTNTALVTLWAYNNSISTLDLSANTALTTLKIGFNSLTNLDVSTNTALINLYCENNLLTNLDVSTNAVLRDFYCQDNSLTSLDVRNGNNANIGWFDARNNPGLSCISVSDIAYASGNWAAIDPGVAFDLDCSTAAPEVNIPDANFKAYLVGEATINTNGDAEIQVSEAAAFSGEISVNAMSISDLTGIEAFTSITILRCNDNSLTNLNVSANTALTYLDCGQNSISNLDVSTNTTLTGLLCYANSLTSLDVSTNTALTVLWCNLNSLTSLDVRNGNNSSLTNFNASANIGLTCISVSDLAFATANWGGIDPGVEFNLECTASSITANFSVDATSGEAPTSIQFTDVSTGTPTSWSWDFGDGTATSDLQSPSHIYTTAGTYSVSLTVGDGTSTETETKVDYITISTSGSDYIMTDGTVTTNSGVFYDTGGANAAYSDNENYTMTFVPETSGNKLKFVFEVFDIEEEVTCGYDLLMVYDSIVAHADALVGTYCNGTPLDQFEATNVDGAVTFVFISDASTTNNGWKATISSIATTTNDTETENNDTYLLSNTMLINSSMAGNIDNTTDMADMYKVTIPYDGSLSFIGIPESSLDLSLELFDIDGVSYLHGCNIHCGYTGENDTLTYRNLMTGTYYMRISGLSGSYGSYTLKNVFVETSIPTGNDTEPNTFYTEALTLALDGSSTGHMGFYSNGITDEADMYKVTIPADESISFISIPGPSLDTRLELYDLDGVSYLKGCDYCGGTGKNDTLTIEILVAGTYYLKISGLSGSYGSYTLKNQVEQISLISDFSANVTVGEAPLTVQFTDQSTGATSWTWDFGDGSTSALQSPSHVYTTEGVYTVSLTVSNGASTDTETKVNYINITLGNSGYIMADGTITTDDGTFYDAGGANANYGNDENYTMTFVPATVGNKLKFVFEVFDIEPATTCDFDRIMVYDSIVAHADALIGTYCNGTPLSQFEATNVDGAVTFVFASDNLLTYGGWKATISSVTPVLIADFSADINSGDTPLTVQFTDISTGSPISWAWDFGDGTSSTAPSPSHTYTEPGTYSVSLLVGDGIGTSTETKVDYITAIGTKVIALSGNLNLSNVDLGATATTTLNIANSGNELLTITGIDLPLGYTADWTSGTIVASGSKNVIITFAPTEAKDYNGTITINGDQTSGTNTITVNGIGITQTITGIDDVERASLNCYPNPVVDLLNITFDHTMESIIIVNMQGVTVFKKSGLEQLNGKLQIDVSRFKLGEYIIQLMKKEKKETLKVLIVK